MWVGRHGIQFYREIGEGTVEIGLLGSSRINQSRWLEKRRRGAPS
jgi:hypothetical protein